MIEGRRDDIWRVDELLILLIRFETHNRLDLCYHWHFFRHKQEVWADIDAVVLSFVLALVVSDLSHAVIFHVLRI